MMLEIVSFVLGPAGTNAYLVADPSEGTAAVIDPAWDGHVITAEAKKRRWKITKIWVTHGHFDHFAGAKAIVEGIDPAPVVALHPGDLPLWQMQGGAPFFGMRIDPPPEPGIPLSHGQILELGSLKFEVRHAPGHSPGHVVFYCADEKLVFCGDVIFLRGIGRTDLPGGSFQTLMRSIHTQILSLPDDTRLLSGHGPETTVGEERRENPFLTNGFMQ
jgi:glyoxylase-like metal-dependent hydrolase (beta-lactamase superfamily II)